jgi:DNA-binding Lrp family transcriptional regulator
MRARLSQKEKEVLWAAQHAADLSVEKLARRLGRQTHTVRYILSKLTDLGIIYPFYVVNIFKLGFSEYNIFFSLKLQDENSFIKFLMDSDEISFLTRTGGKFEYGANICVRNTYEFMAFLDKVGMSFGNIFLNKIFCLRLSYTGFGRKYLMNRKITPIVEIAPDRDIYPLDKTSHRILSVLCQKFPKNHSELSRETGIPISSLEYRMKKLRASGVITNKIYAVTPAKFGMQTCSVLLCTSSINTQFHRELMFYASEHPHIVNLTRCAGAWDYIIQIEAERQEDFFLITRELKNKFAESINDFQLIPRFSHLKGFSYPFKKYHPPGVAKEITPDFEALSLASA